MRVFKRVDTADGPRLCSEFAPYEVTLLRTMVSSLMGLLTERETTLVADPLEQITGIRAGHSQPPHSPTMRRLLPDFTGRPQSSFAESAQLTNLNGALRSIYEPEIIEAKKAVAQRFFETIPAANTPCELTEADAQAWVTAVNDIRLALGTMLEVDAGGSAQLPANHPFIAHRDVYQWLTVLQECLVLALMNKPLL